MNTQQRLIYMANQIAANFGTLTPDKASAAVADHIAMFWDPRMKAMIFADGDGLSPVAGAAIESLKAHGAPDHQTHATQFNAATEAGHCDAG